MLYCDKFACNSRFVTTFGLIMTMTFDLLISKTKHIYLLVMIEHTT